MTMTIVALRTGPRALKAFATVCLALAFAAIALVACSKDKAGARVLAKLVEVVEGQADQRAAKTEWSPAKEGSTFVDGQALRTDEVGVAKLKFAGEMLRMGPDTTVYFGNKKIDFDGEIEVDEGLGELGLDFGEAEVTTTGRLRIVKRKNNVKFEVLVGKATITSRGEVTVAEPGQELEFEIGAGVMVSARDRQMDAGVTVVTPPELPVDGGSTEAAAGALTAEVVGAGVRVRVEESQPWQDLKKGTHELGERAEIELKGRKAKVIVSRGADQVVLIGSGSASLDANAEEFIAVNRGRAVGNSREGDVLIAVPGGTIRLHAEKNGSRAKVDVGRDGALTSVESGRVTVKSGETQESLHGGETANVSKDGVEVTNRAPTTANMTLKSTKAATLHVVKAPANVRIDFRDSCDRGVVEVSKKNTFGGDTQTREGIGSAIVRLGSGTNYYRVRCYEGDTLSKKTAISGRLSVRRDSGSRPLPRGAPRNVIDADGRRYTVLFQNLMPALTFRWRNAPSSASYVLHIKPREGRGKSRQVSTSSASKSFRSGAFAEGAYDYWFTGAGAESKHSQLVVSFDNAAATGYLSSPKANAVLTGSEVRVTGAAVEGWTVRVDGKELRLDGQYRFDQVVPLGPNGIAVQFSHPKYGTHYYLRTR